ncbi:fungal-specific transcription factor domain-containing protein [Fomitopsis serialis]|uniref:fungal-specific transcription factor domain-containing protein n=1 Tax=Fomitopsis serialis TaxID=139415 RepID=UPI002008B8DA|nr:fungal-specific transcription factor domain-containing protein [Neoantrodia serialis]KAH9927316.1 fungal-specific transcription factor domain-containing protein [Neoantrodia serialis]
MPTYSEPSDDERLPSPSERQPSVEQSSRRRSTRACDQCRRTKSKCERDKGAPARKPCHGCTALGLPCTYAGPSHKRGPPKGYILAIERRLHQVEALLGTIIGSEDPRAKGLIQDLSQDQLARQIIQRVDVGPFGRKGRVTHPFGSTKEDFLTSIMTGAGEEIQESSKDDGASPRFDNLALVSPSSTWQDSLQRLLPRASGTAFPQTAVDAGSAGSGSPDHRTRRASFPLMSNRVSSPWRIPPVSPMNSLSSLTSFPTVPPSERVLWDNIAGLEKFDTESVASDDSEVKVPVRVEDVYIDGNAQLRIANQVSGLQILSQCQKILTGREDKSLDCPWPSTDAERTAAQLPPSASMRRPPEQHQHDLVRAFFEHVYPAFPVINKAHFLRLYHQQLNTGVQESLHSSLEQTSFDVLLLSMFALSYRFINTFTEDPDYVTEAERVLFSMRGRAHPLLCQAWLLLAYRNVGIGCLEAAWMYTGIAIRMAQSLGLHRDTQGLFSSGIVSEEDWVARRHVWAGCIIVDRHLSVLLGRPPMIDATDCDVSPVAIIQGNALHLQTDLGLGSNGVADSTILMCFNASCALGIGFVGAVIDQLYAITRPADAVLELRAKRLEHQLSQWRNALPAQVQLHATSSVPPACALELHIRYWWTVILLYRSFVQGPLVKSLYASPDSVESKALVLCRDASTQLSSLVRMLCNQTPEPASPFLPGYVLSSGIVDLLNLSIAHDDHQANVRLRGSLSALQHIEKTWPAARSVHGLLDKAMSLPPSTPVIPPESPTTLRRKRSAQEVFSEDEHAEHGSRQMMEHPASSPSFSKDH